MTVNTMADAKNMDATMDDEYDEAADGDFDAENASVEVYSSSSEDDKDQISSSKQSRAKPQSRAHGKAKSQPGPLDLDSGDEATIQERKFGQRRRKQTGQDEREDLSDLEEQGWRAKTRAMRERDQVEKKKSRLASAKGSTVDVGQMWEAMNRPGGLDDLLRPTRASVQVVATGPADEQKGNIGPPHILPDESQDSHEGLNDMITIDETYEFAGEVHHRKKTVPRSSAEAKLWVSQRSYQNTDPRFEGDAPIRRPLRKISRFDPNVNNLDSFKKNWERTQADGKRAKAHKINTVEKSKMDWAAHVDEEGLQDELSENAKAKAGYLGRMDFLGQVEQRQEEEARRLRLKG